MSTASGTVTIPDPNNPGQCCSCDQQSGCTCVGGGCKIFCQSITGPTGTGTYCGYAEYIPSVPPNYYLAKVLSGGTTISCGNSACGALSCSQSLAYSGANNYDAVTCAFTQNGKAVNSGGCDPAQNGTVVRDDVNTIDVIGLGGNATFNIQDQYTATTHTLIPLFPGSCVVSHSGFVGCVSPASSCGTATLTNPDTVYNAIARAIAGQSYRGNDCGSNYSFATFPNTGSRVFAFKQAQVKVQFNGQPGATYTVTVNLGQRQVGTVGPLLPYGQIQFSVTVPPNGVMVTNWQDIPIEQGYEVHATGCAVSEH